MVSSCLSTQAVEQVGRMDQVGQMESNGLNLSEYGVEWTPFDYPSQMVKWCLVTSALKL